MTRPEREQRGKAVRERQEHRLSVVLPIPPSTNHLYATVRGNRVLSKAGRDYHHDASWIAKEAAAVIGWRATRRERYAVEIVLFWPNRLRRDLDNNAKCLLDSVALALGFDDSQVDELVIRRGSVDKEQPRAELTIMVLAEARAEGEG